MLIGNEPAPWQYYVKQFPGVPIEQLRQRYLAEQLQYFQQVEQMYNQMSIDGASQQNNIVVEALDAILLENDEYLFMEDGDVILL